ncbi:MAG TPA: type I polyketide synthase, partial [Thermoanaerobaculia bacterium]
MTADLSATDALQGIAIVGLAARFPGAGDAAELWRNLRDGVESIAVFTDEELAAAGVGPELLADPRYVRAKGALAGADLFDAPFFGFTPREAEVLDPQHRVFLECAWEALEDAGCDPARPAGRIGLWAGSGPSSYLLANLLPNAAALERLGGFQVMLLNDRDFFATRAAYKLDLKGPAALVQTACSTSLVATHMACQSLLSGECDLALAGGSSISAPLRTGYLHQEGDVVSPDGHCRAFDAAAAGAVEGNGCGVVALKRLSDALADGDRIHAVIRGSAVNNDGAGKVGFTAPSVEGQAEVISESLLMAGVEPATIGYVEAHGSGTPLGDPIEVAALTQAFRAAGAEGEGFCALGSVKTNLGHCNTAAGVAGLIKATLALEHRTVPPSLHFETPNPQLGLAASPFYVPTRATAWERGEEPRRAGVSSFGLGGTNAHLVLEEAPEPAPGDPPARPAQLLVLSARTATALDAAAARLADRLEADPALDLADVAWTLQVGRQEFEHRRIAVARDREGAVVALRDPRALAGRTEGVGGSGARPVVFLFPGLGDQRIDMARELYETESAFRAD